MAGEVRVYRQGYQPLAICSGNHPGLTDYTSDSGVMAANASEGPGYSDTTDPKWTTICATLRCKCID